MNKKELEAFARETAKGIKTEKDLSDFSQMLTKITIETTLDVELDDRWVRQASSLNCNTPHRYNILQP